jgi:hypothetical protein
MVRVISGQASPLLGMVTLGTVLLEVLRPTFDQLKCMSDLGKGVVPR